MKTEFWVMPEHYTPGYCPTVCETRAEAETEGAKLEEITGFKWIIIKK